MNTLSTTKSNTYNKKRVVVSSSSIVARYFKWSVSAVRTSGNAMQLAELSFLYNGTRVSYTGATTTDSQNKTDSQGNQMSIDNNISTKWLAVSAPVSLTVTFPSNITMNQYQICTAEDAPDRDPISWILSSSTDNVYWFIIDSQTNYAITTLRQTYTPLISAVIGVPIPDLVWWKFNTIDVVGSTLFNYATNTYDTISTGADMTTAYTTSPFSGTGSFYKLSSGTTSVSRVSNSFSRAFTTTQVLTISYWFKSLVVSPAYAPVFQSQVDGGYITSLRINTSGTSLGIQFGGGVFNMPTALPAGITNINDAVNWYHIIIALSGTTIKFYFNNVIAGAPIAYSNFPAGTYNMTTIGTDWNDVDNNGNGKFQLDDLRYYSLELTADERTELYNFRG